MNINIDTDGKIEFIYSDDLAQLLEQGAATVTRASHVEPHPNGGGWIADMSPSCADGEGLVLGTNGSWFIDIVSANGDWAIVAPFKTRTEALAAEVAWLQQHRGL